MYVISLHNKALHLGWMLFLSGWMNAQTMSASDYLNSTFVWYETNSKQNNYSDSSLDPPVIKELGFRAESDDLNFNNYGLQFRMSLNNREERHASKSLLNGLVDANRISSKISLLNALEESYLGLIGIYFARKRQYYYDSLLSILYQKEQVYKNLIATGKKIDLEKWYDNKNEIKQFKIKKKGSNEKIKQFLSPYSTKDISGDRIIFLHWIKPIKIRRFVLGIHQPNELHPKFLQQKYKRNIALSEWNIEQAKAHKWFDFIQAKYSSSDKYNFQKAVSIGISLTVPIPGIYKINLEKAKIKLLETEESETLISHVLSFQKQKSLQHLLSLLERYDTLLKIDKEIGLAQTVHNYQEAGMLTPLLFLGMQQSAILDKIEQLNLLEEVYKAYIDYLKITSELIVKPYKYYLSEDLVSLPINNQK